jgi:Protein of unknown function (DUF3750)
MRKRSILWLLAPLLLFGFAYVDHDAPRLAADWWRASRSPVGFAPDPERERRAVVQVYAARTVRWRGYFGVHTWIAAKAADADGYVVYEVTGWQLRRTNSAISVSNRAPDGRWFGSKPELVAQSIGLTASALIPRIEAAVRDYPYRNRYRVWPGPNSNTFTAFVLRAVPELRADLPPTAIGKDYLGPRLVARSPSGTGAQISVFGLLGVLAGLEEGLEINLLGLTFGIDPGQLALKLPLAGRIGFGAPVRADESPYD